MEEILASIRQIISDDQGAPAKASPAASAGTIVEPPRKEQPAPRAPAPVEDDDILDLIAPERPARPVSPSQSFASLKQAVTAERLLSPEANEAISAAFGNLAHTVLAQNARTLDDIVLDLLRPMLKTWLDDNLPSIVERLVRAEIERVARGGR